MTNTDTDWGEVIIAHTAADAVESGDFHRLPESLTDEAGYGSLPVVLTRAAYADAITWTRTDGLEDETGRTWDVLWMAKRAALAALEQPGERFAFEVYRTPNTTRSGAVSHATTASRLRLHLVAQGYDLSGRPCITILRPEED